MSNLLSFTTEPVEVEADNPTIYKAVKTDMSGLSPESDLIFGLMLKVETQGTGYDPVQERIDNIGCDAYFIPPKEGLIEGKLYKAKEVCSSTDWESGLCDDTEVYIEEVV